MYQPVSQEETNNEVTKEVNKEVKKEVKTKIVTTIIPDKPIKNTCNLTIAWYKQKSCGLFKEDTSTITHQQRMVISNNEFALTIKQRIIRNCPITGIKISSIKTNWTDDLPETSVFLTDGTNIFLEDNLSGGQYGRERYKCIVYLMVTYKDL